MITDSKQKGKYIFGVVRIGDKGQIVIPKEAREVFGLKPGDTLLVLGDVKQGLALCKTEVFQPFAEEIFGERRGDGKDGSDGNDRTDRE